MSEKVKIKRVKTGIRGFDKLIEGGFLQGSIINISGPPGTGKTIFGLEFLYNGITKFDEHGLLVTFESPRYENILIQAQNFGWDLKKLVDDEKLFIMTFSDEEFAFNSTMEKIQKYIKEHKIKRLVVDSLSTFLNCASNGDIKHFAYIFNNKLRDFQEVTKIFITEASDHLAFDGSRSEYYADGLILTNYKTMGDKFNSDLIVRKMRSTKNDSDMHPIEIKKGLIVHTLESSNIKR